jgi:acetyl esterase/lipase
MGFSAGAHLVALAATAGPEAGLDVSESQKQSNSIAACIVVAGPSITNDERAFLEARKPESNYQLFLGDLPENIPAIYEKASPAHWVTGNEPPMLFITEGNPSAHNTIRSKLDKLGIQNEIFNLTGGLHSEWNWEPWFTPTMEVTETFIHSTITH